MKSHMNLRHSLLAFLTLALYATSLFAADEKKPVDPAAAKKKITYEEHILPIFRAKCGACHSADQAKGGLVVDNFGRLMQGGSSGEVITAGDPDASHLWELVNHQAEPKMPPKEPKLPEETLALIKGWIEGGALEKSSSTSTIKKKANALGAAMITTGRPAGPPPLPEGLPTDPSILSPRGNSVTALAVSPWAPLVAVSGHKQVLLYNSTDGRLMGILPFPEGVAHVLKFSRNGSLLIAGGGRAGQSGKAIVWDVKTGKRVFEVGNEYDAVLAADISSDHSLIALGGPRKIVRVFSTKDGEQLYEIKKHTDWITSLEFSPDSVLLATADRSNGLFVWEAQTGREFYVLNGHTAPITAVSWRPDSNILASGAEDGTVKLWEMTNGTLVKNWAAQSGAGVECVAFARDGRLVSTGRDGFTRLWDQNGAQQRQFPSVGDVGMETIYSAEDDRVLTGDWNGIVRIWSGKDGAELNQIVTNPATLAIRTDKAKNDLKAAEGTVAPTAAALAALQKEAAAKQAVIDAAGKPLNDAKQQLAAMQAAEAAARKPLADRDAQLKDRDANFLKAKQTLDAALVAKATAEKVLAETPDAGKPAIQADLNAKTAAYQQALGAVQLALNSQQEILVAQTLAARDVTLAAARTKQADDKLKAATAEYEKIVAANKPTPEFSQKLAAADAAAKGAVEKVAQLKQVIQIMESEKGRTLQTAAN